jgi:hypothetical protein
MPLVCPQCKQLYDQNGVCPLCNVVLLYHAQNLQQDATSASIADEGPSAWQQTPWGKILVGLILAQGLSFGLQQLLTAGFLATGDGGDVWGTLLGIVMRHAILGVSLLIAGALSGAGQRRGIVYGALVGVVSGLISLGVQAIRMDAAPSMLSSAVPLVHLFIGALGGALGMLIWRPTPQLPELEGNTPTPVPASTFGSSLEKMLSGPVHIGRVSAGAFIIVMGVVWSKAILDFLLRASGGALTISSQLQAQLVSMEITALAALFGAAFAGATTRNGLKQGMCVGIAAAAIVLGMQISSPKFALEPALFTLSGIITVALVGGWFGGQLFPPIGERRKRGPSYL